MVVENDDMLYKKKQIDLAARSSSEHMRHMIESGTGNFQVKFQLYRDDQFTDKVRNTIVPQLSVHDQLRVRLRLYEPLPHAKWVFGHQSRSNLFDVVNHFRKRR